MGILGNTAITACTFVLPCILYIKRFKDRMSIYHKCFCWSCGIIGFITGLCGVVTVVISLI